MMKTITARLASSLRQTPIRLSARSYVSSPAKRFYKQTGVLHSGNDSFEVTLDNRKLKTPSGTPLVLRSEALAAAVAAEWGSQLEKIERSTMHLTALCNTAIDNPHRLQKEDSVGYILNFLPTDTILFHSGGEDDDELYLFQCAEWDPVLEWFNQRFGTDIRKTRDIMAPTISAGDRMRISKHLLSYDAVAMHGFVFAVDVLKSLILTLAVVDRRVSVEQAVRLSRLEEEHQVRQWGRVEFAHDVSQLDSQARLAASVLFVHFNSTEHLVKEKLAI